MSEKEGVKLILINPYHEKYSKEIDDNMQTKNYYLLKEYENNGVFCKRHKMSNPYIQESFKKTVQI